jgi:amino acid adenylation domain-containing protein
LANIETPLELYPNFSELLWRTAHDCPAATALVERSGQTDYASFLSRASRFAAALQKHGLRPGDRVAIFLDRGADAAAAFFGVLAAGGIVTIINETLRPLQIEHILQLSGATHLLTAPAVLQRLPRKLATTATIQTTSDLPDHADLRPAQRIGSDAAQLIFTSGSTGLPKGVTVSHANLWAGTHAVTGYLGIRRADRIASLLPFSFDYGLNQLFCAVARGAALVFERSPLARDIATSLRDQRVSVLAAVPPLWLQLLSTTAFTDEALPDLRIMTNTGGRIPTAAVRRLRAAHPHADLFLMYGLTEAFRATYLPPHEVDHRPDSIGRAIPGSEIYVLRDDLSECAPGEEGELVQRGPTVTLGYWNDPQATARVFRSNPIRPVGVPDAERVVFSGDVVKRDDDGFLYFVGRRDQMMKTMGFRVSPDEITNVLYASGQVADALVTTLEDEARGSLLIAAIVLHPEGSLDRTREFARTELPRYMQPAEIVTLSELPRTSSGKHDPGALRELLRERKD